MTHSAPAPKALWSSRFSFVMAATGAAVGLGNIWKFPYMAGDNGGSAFVLVYLLSVALIGIPAMLSEVILGRLGRQSPTNTMKTLAAQFHAHPAWQLVGWIGATTLVIVLSFYSVVAGWSIAYIGKAMSGAFRGLSSDGVARLWGEFLSTPRDLLIFHSVFMILTLGVVAAGVQKGLERASKIMMPSLFLILCILVGYAAINGDFLRAVNFLFAFDLHQVTPGVVIDALGHAFFTLAVGAGAMLVYGAYVDPDTRLVSTLSTIALLDVLVAMLSGLAIFPLVFAFGLTPEAGPGLMFKVLPIAFSDMPAGDLVGALFFVLIFFAAWTSSLSMAEPLVVLFMERTKFTRRFASVVVGVFAWVLGIISVLSFNVWSDVVLFGRWDLFTVITDLATNILLPIGGLGFVIFTGWCIPKAIIAQQLDTQRALFSSIYPILRYITPLGILLIMITGLV